MSKQFLFNTEWAEVLMGYPSEVRLEVYDAIIEYVASGTPPELKPMAKMAFAFIRKEIDSQRVTDVPVAEQSSDFRGFIRGLSVLPLWRESVIRKHHVADSDIDSLLDNFANHLVSVGEENTVQCQQDAKRRFTYWLSNLKLNAKTTINHVGTTTSEDSSASTGVAFKGKFTPGCGLRGKRYRTV